MSLIHCLEARKQRREKDYDRCLTKTEFTRDGLWDANGLPFYGLWHNSMFTRILKPTLKKRGTASNLRRSALFGEKVIFDCSWEGKMKDVGIMLAMQWTASAYAINRRATKEPFDLWFTNFHRNTKQEAYLRKFFPILDNVGTHMVNIREEHYLDLFPREKLVYLSPQGRTTLTELNPEDIYIIGVLEDNDRDSMAYTLKRAKMEGIRSAKFPLNQANGWTQSNNSLSVNTVMKILICLKNGLSWEKALRVSVPDCFFKTNEQLIREEQIRYKRFVTQKR